MRNSEVNTKRLRLAQLRYFDKEKNASLIPDEKAYVFMIDVNGTFVNLFNPIEELPVYDRVPYTNTTLDGEDYGTKLVLVNGEVEDGLCYILERKDMESLFGEKVSMRTLENYIINSSSFFIDRMDLLKSKKSLKNRKILLQDLVRLDKFNDYIESHKKGVQYSK